MSVAVDFSTIPELFDSLTTKYATSDRPMLMHKVEKQYRAISFAQFRRKVELFALGIASLGVKKEERVAIMSENRPEWVIADMGIVTLGGVDVPIYPTLTPPQISYVLNDADVRIVIVSNALQLGKILKIESEVKTLQRTIVINEKIEQRNSKTC